MSSTAHVVLLRLGAIADKPGDDDEQRLRHRLLIFGGLAMSGGGLLWGTLSVVFGLVLEAIVPYAYVVLTAVNLLVLKTTKRFGPARIVQIGASLLLPFAFQWALGGFMTSGAMMAISRAVISLIDISFGFSSSPKITRR